MIEKNNKMNVRLLQREIKKSAYIKWLNRIATTLMLIGFGVLGVAFGFYLFDSPLTDDISKLASAILKLGFVAFGFMGIWLSDKRG